MVAALIEHMCKLLLFGHILTAAIGGGFSSSIKAFQFWFSLSWGLTLGLGALHTAPV